ncbi:MAG: hypothetical protein WD064_02150, partial [Acidimicrobiia bacterium]
MRRPLRPLAILALVLFSACATEEGGIDVIDVSGPLDTSALEFMRVSIESAAENGQEVAVLQVDSPAVLDEAGLAELIEIVRDPPLPVATWVGPAPAMALGSVSQLVEASQHNAISPFSRFGPEGTPAEKTGLDLQPTIRQYLQDLDGETFHTSAGPVVVETLKPFEDGVTLKTVTFRQPGLGTRFFRLAATPETAFFFLAIGLTIVSFEFFAIGPG